MTATSPPPSRCPTPLSCLTPEMDTQNCYSNSVPNRSQFSFNVRARARAWLLSSDWPAARVVPNPDQPWVMYVKGAEDLPRNDVLAVRYLSKAVDSGDPTAALNLGKMCEAGRGGPMGMDDNAALKFVQMAAEGGHVRAQCKLAAWHAEGGPAGSGFEAGGNWKEAASGTV